MVQVWWRRLDDRRCLVRCNTWADRRVQSAHSFPSHYILILFLNILILFLSQDRKIAQLLSTEASTAQTTLIDCFAGVGGNSIAFALSGRWHEIHAIEKDFATLECAKHNAEIYGVAGKISWHLGDCFTFLHKRPKWLKQENSVLFASPPWGGKGISKQILLH